MNLCCTINGVCRCYLYSHTISECKNWYCFGCWELKIQRHKELVDTINMCDLDSRAYAEYRMRFDRLK